MFSFLPPTILPPFLLLEMEVLFPVKWIDYNKHTNMIEAIEGRGAGPDLQPFPHHLHLPRFLG